MHDLLQYVNFETVMVFISGILLTCIVILPKKRKIWTALLGLVQALESAKKNDYSWDKDESSKFEELPTDVITDLLKRVKIRATQEGFEDTLNEVVKLIDPKK